MPYGHLGRASGCGCRQRAYVAQCGTALYLRALGTEGTATNGGSIPLSVLLGVRACPLPANGALHQG
eukprot:3247920-Pyramimonas_sp.AAC.1